MKNILAKTFLATACAASISLTSCIDEAVPTSYATAEQLASSSKATEALVWAMPAFLNNLGTYNSDYAYDWGYGSLMHMRDVMTADMAIVSSGYNWYSSWSSNSSLGPRYVSAYFAWTYYWKAIQTTNNLIRTLDPASCNEAQLGLLGAGHAYRALFYLDAARSYEFLPNDKTSSVSEVGNNIVNLTVPIVDEKTTEDQARNNPRATREQMYEFILSDLNKAEEYIVNLDKEDAFKSSKILPHLCSVYGLKARLYMWVEDYENAEKYARLSIDEGTNSTFKTRPLTKDEWLNTESGFNDASAKAWMWASQTTEEDDVVKTGILNWTSWLSNETSYGYASAGPFVMIAADLYNKINNDDFRKLSFKAPATNPLSGTEPVIDKDIFDGLPVYSSLKFRPGKGNTEEYKVASSCAYPLMRVEEMYLIEAEAAAHTNAAKGKTLLESFMKTYRYASYNCKASSQDDIVAEVVLQKRIELFGEGQSFYDYKRLNMSVDRTLSANVDETERFKTDGRPCWMNLTIPTNEITNNKGLEGYENPDPSDKYDPVK